MFTVTDDAKKELKRIYDSRSLEVGMYLRLAIPPVWTGYGDFGIVIDVSRFVLQVDRGNHGWSIAGTLSL